jgi:phosphohistidine swiveling domain-containing protein
LSQDEISKVEEGDILVTTMTTPDMVPAMKKAAAIVTEEGGLTCHAAIVSRELGVPAVVGTEKATKVLKDGMIVTVDGDKGIVYAGALKEKKREERPVAVAQVPIITATEVKVNISIPDAAEKAAATGADGVGLFRIEHMVLGLKKHPMPIKTSTKSFPLWKGRASLPAWHGLPRWALSRDKCLFSVSPCLYLEGKRNITCGHKRKFLLPLTACRGYDNSHSLSFGRSIPGRPISGSSG